MRERQRLYPNEFDLRGKDKYKKKHFSQHSYYPPVVWINNLDTSLLGKITTLCIGDLGITWEVTISKLIFCVSLDNLLREQFFKVIMAVANIGLSLKSNWKIRLNLLKSLTHIKVWIFLLWNVFFSDWLNRSNLA